MKFGKRIRSEAVAAWSPFYIDYKELKHLLKQLVAKVCRESFSLRWRASRAPSRAREHVPGIPAQPPVVARQSDGCWPAAHAHETMREGTVAAVRSPLRVGARPVT